MTTKARHYKKGWPGGRANNPSKEPPGTRPGQSKQTYPSLNQLHDTMQGHHPDGPDSDGIKTWNVPRQLRW